MNEQLISYLWKYRLYDQNLTTTTGLPVTVIKTGEQHGNAGPDFFNARIKVGDTLWAGNVEIHVKSSDWYRHGHQTDKAYDNVILHVVYEADTEIIQNNLLVVPTVALSNQMDEGVLERINVLRDSDQDISCGSHMMQIEPMKVKSWLDRMLVERLEHKSGLVELALHANRNDWEDAFYQLLARNFGFKVNAVPFEMLSRILPRKLLLRYQDRQEFVEALVYGQAGFLEEEMEEEYPAMLKSEYRFLARKHGLMPMDRHLWKFLRMRPANFPTIRLSQFAMLITRNRFSFSDILQMRDPAQLMERLKVQTSGYWETHYMMNKTGPHAIKSIGYDSISNIIINTVAPTLFFYGRRNGDEQMVDRALELLSSIPYEKNKVLDSWSANGIHARNAFDSQALLHLHANYCCAKRCLDCAIGREIVAEKSLDINMCSDLMNEAKR